VLKFVVGGCSGEIQTFLTARATLRPICGDAIINNNIGAKTAIGGFIDAARREEVKLIPTVYSSVGAGPMPTKDSYEQVKSEILRRITMAGKIDGILLAMHGALVVEGMSDGAEADFVQAIKDVVGLDIPIVCTADPHANVSESWVEKVNAIFGYNSIPHIDSYEIGVEATKALIKIITGKLHPVMAIKKPGMLVPMGLQLVNYPGERGPLPKVFKIARKWENVKGVINVNVFVGFNKSDVENAGASVVVITDNDQMLANRATEEVTKILWNVREEFSINFKLPQEAVKIAIESNEWPVVLHDQEDDPTGGGTGDGTEILRTMIEMGVKNATIWLHDSEAVCRAIEAGVRNSVTMKIGGKLIWREDKKHAQPLEITGRVKTISDGVIVLKGPQSTGQKRDIGRSVVIDVNGIDVMLTEERSVPIPDPQLFRSVGIEPTDKKIIVIKQEHHWRAAYEPIVKRVISVHCPTDYSTSTSGGINPMTGKPAWPYQKVKRPIWPLDKDAEMW